MKGPPPYERLRQVRELFEKLAERPPEERAAFLDATCREDANLRQEVLTLLAEVDSADSPFRTLAHEMIWPALHSLRSDPEQLEDWLDMLVDPVPEQADLLIGKSISHFDILEPIGRGGMGMVYRAHDRTLERTVALKFLPPSMSTDEAAKDHFMHEAKAASGLDHPNIATIHEIGETEDGQLFIAMGYYPGESLKERIARGPIPPAEALNLAIQLAEGIAKAHAHGVIHRDIKPGNVQITSTGTVTLLDFGLAKLSYESGYTQIGQVLGTIAYMSPEQARGERIDHRTDLWSFGVVFYETLTGKRPFGGDSAPSALHKILHDDPEPPTAANPGCPKALEQILARCLAKDPAQRYPSAHELLEELDRARQGLAPRNRGARKTWKRRPATESAAGNPP